jgi:hypothetical protein
MEAVVYPSYTGGVGLTATKNVRKLLTAPAGMRVGDPEYTRQLYEHVRVLKSRPDVFPKIYGQSPGGYTMERLTPIKPPRNVIRSWWEPSAPIADFADKHIPGRIVTMGNHKHPVKYRIGDLHDGNFMRRRSGARVISDPSIVRKLNYTQDKVHDGRLASASSILRDPLAQPKPGISMRKLQVELLHSQNKARRQFEAAKLLPAHKYDDWLSKHPRAILMGLQGKAGGAAARIMATWRKYAKNGDGQWLRDRISAALARRRNS